MKIAIDVSSVVYGTGVSVYAKELIKALVNLKTKNEFLLFAGTLRQRRWYQNWFEEMNLPDNFELKVIPLSPRLQLTLWNDVKLTKLEWFIGKFDVYHSLDWSLAPTDKPTVVTVHDLFFIKEKEIQQHPYQKSLEARLINAKERDCPVIAVSNTTKDDLVDICDYDKSLVQVIYEASPHNWKKIDDKDNMTTTRNKWQIPIDYILAVGTREPRKNLARLIESYDKLDCKISLVIVGKSGWGEKVNANEKIILTGYISDEDLMTLWSGAKGFVYPSLYEGFGLPILQSFISEVPVLTSNNSSMKEIASDAAILVDPSSIDSIKDGLEELINLSKEKRERLVAAGLARAKKFSWEDTANKTMKIYEQIA